LTLRKFYGLFSAIGALLFKGRMMARRRQIYLWAGYVAFMILILGADIDSRKRLFMSDG
jgi:hypothetical protein